MAAAKGLITNTNLPLVCRSSSTPSSSKTWISFPKQLKMRRLVSSSERFLPLNTRCEAVSDILVRGNTVDSMSNHPTIQFLNTSTANRYTKERSSIIVIGLNVHTSPVEMREKFTISEEKLPQAIAEICALNHIEEAGILSTCNRIEIYVVALSQERGVKEVTQWMSKISGVAVSDLNEHRFILYKNEAIQHLFRVSAGLDSLVLGEGQILGQVKQVVKLGEQINDFGAKIGGLFKHAIRVGKRVRTETNIGAGAVSVSAAAVELALLKLPQLTDTNVLVVGAGKMAKLIIKHLFAKGCKKMVVVNRREDRVDSIKEEMKDIEIVYKPLTELHSCLAQAHLIFTSTASKTPLLYKEHIENLPNLGSEIGGKRIFVDISVPRNVGSCISDLETVSVYNIDDLKEVVEANKEDRQKKAMEAEIIVEEEVKECEGWIDSMETVPTIKKLRAYAEKIRASEFEKCMSMMGDDLTKKQKGAIYGLSMGIMNKLLHGPMEHLRCDTNENRTLNEILENMESLNKIFGLETTEIKPS